MNAGASETHEKDLSAPADDATDGERPHPFAPAGDVDGAKPSRWARHSGRLRRLALTLDSHHSLLSAARLLREELPGDDQFGDPLSTAGPQPVEVLARRVSALGSERRSVTQEIGLAALQVWQSLSEATGRGHGDRELAVLFTDLVGFSQWALRAGDDPALALLREVGTRVEAAIVGHRGRIVKRLGDGVMATFLEPREAVDAALDAQSEVSAIEFGGHRPEMRVGLHWGSPRKLGGDYLGIDVNVAARVCEAAKAGEVVVSDAVLAQISTDGLRTGRPKRLRADGAPRELHVVRLSRD
jgi:adenylate cyclase